MFFIRTDASDEDFASRDQLVFVPKLEPLAADGLSQAAYLFEGGTGEQPPVVSSVPGRDGYTPAWRIHRARFTATPAPSARPLRSAPPSVPASCRSSRPTSS